MKKSIIPLFVILPAVLFVSSSYLVTDKSKKEASASNTQMTANFDTNGQVVLAENGKPILRYNYGIVYEDDEYAFNGLDANEYVKTETDTFMANPSIYAVPRSTDAGLVKGPSASPWNILGLA